MTTRSAKGLRGFATLLAAAIASTASAVSMYAATPVGAPNAGSYVATSINASGRMAGWYFGPGFAFTHAWVEQGGVIQDIGTLGGRDSYAYAISANGNVTGSAQLPGSLSTHAFLHQGGALIDLGTLGGTGAAGHAVNDFGQVVGDSTLPGDAASAAFLYSNGVMTDIGSLGGGGSLALGINNSGHVVGISNVAGRQYAHGFLYANGVMTDIGTLAGTNVPDGFFSAALAINDLGQVTGQAAELQWGPSHAFLYANGVMKRLDPGVYESYGRALNNLGDVTGSMYRTGQSDRRAFVASGGSVFDLNDLVVTGTAGWPLVDGVAINDTGQIVAQSCLGNQCVHLRLDPVPSVKGPGTIVANPYGALSISGATVTGNTITDVTGDVVITLGPVAGAPDSFAQIDFAGLNIGPDRRFTVRAGAPGQTLVLRNLDAYPLTVVGTIESEIQNGIFARLVLRSRSGVTVTPGGRILGWGGATVDALGDTWYDGNQAVINQGFISGGSQLAVNSWAITGSGEFQGDDVRLSTLAFANNPIHGGYFLQNGLRVTPGAGADVHLTLNGYGGQPQVFNFAVTGNAIVSMPSAWPVGSALPPNDAPVPLAGMRPAGIPPPVYGGGSMIVQATGSLALDGGVSNDFVFTGGIVLSAGSTIDTRGVVVTNGWSTTGTQFQGVFFEAPQITSSLGPIAVYTNGENWVNFNVRPAAPVTAGQLVKDSFGNALYGSADLIATHLNAYSVVSNAAAAGQCWQCLINPFPVDLR